MQRTFTINGKEYTAPTFDLNTVCDMQEIGVDITDLQGKNIAAVRAYFALCLRGRKDIAGKELQEHLIAGGTMDDLINVMSKELDESDFFQALSKRTETQNTETKSKKG